MATPTGFSTRLLYGLAQHLHTAGVGVWQPGGGTYGTGVVALWLGDLPAAPDLVAALSLYDIAHDGTLSDSVHGLQVRTRGTANPTVVDDIDDAVFDQLQGLEDVDLPSELGTVRLRSSYRRSSTPMPPDVNRRRERSSNYVLTVHRPSPNRS